MKSVPAKRYPVRCALASIPVLVLALSMSGCGPKRSVYIPSEWQTPSPAPQAAVKPSPLKPQKPASQPSAGPILKRPPEFKEMNVAPGEETQSTPSEKKAAPPPPPPPQHLASMHLVDQAKASLAQGKPDAAIPMLEQAIQVDVYNGEAFLGLARAWRMKGSRPKALEFARKAEIIFQDEPAKLKEVYLLQADLYGEMGDAKKKEAYRQKASRL